MKASTRLYRYFGLRGSSFIILASSKISEFAPRKFKHSPCQSTTRVISSFERGTLSLVSTLDSMFSDSWNLESEARRGYCWGKRRRVNQPKFHLYFSCVQDLKPGSRDLCAGNRVKSRFLLSIEEARLEATKWNDVKLEQAQLHNRSQGSKLGIA